MFSVLGDREEILILSSSELSSSNSQSCYLYNVNPTQLESSSLLYFGKMILRWTTVIFSMSKSFWWCIISFYAGASWVLSSHQVDRSLRSIVVIKFCKLLLPEKGHQDFYPFASSNICSSFPNPLNYGLYFHSLKKFNLHRCHWF